MSLGLIITGIVSLVSLLLGAFAGHARGKSVGKVEGAQAAEQKQAEVQKDAQHEATTQRLETNEKVAAATDADLDERLSEFDRKG